MPLTMTNNEESFRKQNEINKEDYVHYVSVNDGSIGFFNSLPYTLRSPRLMASISSGVRLTSVGRREASYKSLICFMHSLCVT